jgi:hypothetical protein
LAHFLTSLLGRVRGGAKERRKGGKRRLQPLQAAPLQACTPPRRGGDALPPARHEGVGTVSRDVGVSTGVARHSIVKHEAQHNSSTAYITGPHMHLLDIRESPLMFTHHTHRQPWWPLLPKAEWS